MACELPSVTGGGAPMGVGLWDGAAFQDATKGHPFDKPFNVMKALQSEVNELRAAAQQESKRRESEATRLQNELTELQRALAEERARRTTNCDGVERAFSVELAQVQKALQEARLEASAALKEQRKITVGDLDAVRAQVAALYTAVDSERRERLAAAKELSDRIGANTVSQDNFAKKVTMDLDNHIRLITDLEAHGKRQSEQITELFLMSSDHGKAIAEHQTERTIPLEDFIRDLTSRTAATEKTIEDFRASTASAIREHWKSTTTDIGELRWKMERQGADFDGKLEAERRQRQDAVKGLQPQVQANEEACKRALVGVANLTSGHFGNPRSKNCAVCLEDRGDSPGKLTPRPPPQPRERRSDLGPPCRPLC